MAMAATVPRYTAEEVRQFEDRGVRYEVIRGDLFVTPAPGTPHQLLVVELAHLLYDYLAVHHLGRVITGPFEVEFSDDSAVQPDLLVVLHTQRSRLTPERHQGPPALVIEIISYSSKRTDRLQKRELYLSEGVPEYWIVDPDLKRIEHWRPDHSAPEILTKEITWQPTPKTPPLAIELPHLFRASEI